MKKLIRLWRLFMFATFYLPIIILVGLLSYETAIAYGMTAWESLVTAGVSLLGGALTFVLLAVTMRRPSKTFGSASFATDADLRRAGLRRWRGLILGKKFGRFIRLRRPGHLLTFAPTRSGKGVGLVIPNLLDHPGSVVVTDIKGENYRITAKHRATLGPVFPFAPFDDDIDSARFNPLDFVRVGSPNDVDDARLIAEMLVAPDW